MADASNDFAALARQYMALWGDAMRGVAAPPPVDPGLQGMRDMLEAWMRQAGSTDAFGPTLAHFNRQCSDWYAQMQQVAARFAGRDHSAADVAAAWREAFAGSHPFAGLVDGMRGPGLEGVAQWMDAASASLQGLRADAAAALRMPAFGFTREHQERLQALALAQLRWQDAQQAYGKLMGAVSRDAMARFEAKLAEHEEPGRQIGSVRALFDLWVDAAEEAWAQMALSPEYRHAFGELVNAQMRQRAAAQAVGEQAAATFGWPARSELDGAYRRLAEVERQLRRLQRRDDAPAPPAPAPRASGVKKKAAAKPATARKATKSAARVTPTRTAKAAPVKPAPAKSARTTRKIAKTPARKR
jgi:class III poly(R)-hydroxyalkanoic acid synthase PhaE subunit